MKTATVELTQQEANLVLRAVEVLGGGVDGTVEPEVIDRIWNKVFDAGRAVGFGSPEKGLSDSQTHDVFDYPEEDDITGYPV